jgi:ATP phosphoribosyltransferase
MQKDVLRLLEDAGIDVRAEPRGYRATLSIAGYGVKLLKPQNVVEMLHAGSRDLGFAGADWVRELDADLVELLDTGADPVRLVVAAPVGLCDGGRFPERPLVVASEYRRLTEAWIKTRGLSARFVRSNGATEVFPPEDADLIIDNMATGSTLRANGLEVVDDVMRSSTRLYANPRVLDDRDCRGRIEDLVLVLRSVLAARERVMLEVNVSSDKLDSLVRSLPCMRQPTVAPLHGAEAFAVKVAVLRSELPELIPQIKALGGSDLVVTEPSQIVL